MPLAVIALALGSFAIGLAEFVAMGLLPDIAGSLGVSIPAAGYLVSIYALGVVVGAPLLAAAGVRLASKHLLLLLMGMFSVGNVLSASAPEFGWLVAGRFLAGLPHGAFFGLGCVVAARLARPGKEGRAVATLLLGVTLATVAGVPAATAMGQHLGWRAAFLAIAVIGAIDVIALAVFVPQHRIGERATLTAEMRAFRDPLVVLFLVTGLFGFAGVFATYAYLAPITTEIAGLPHSAVAWMFGLCGVGMTVGVSLAGRLTDRFPYGTTFVSLGGLITVLLVFYFEAHIGWLAMVLVAALGAFGFMMITPLQTMVIRHAADAPTLAAAANPSAFNLANAGGVWLAGLTIGAGWGLMSAALTGAVLALIGTVLAVAAHRVDTTGNVAAGGVPAPRTVSCAAGSI